MGRIDEATEGLLVTGFMVGPAAFGIEARLVGEVVRVGEITPVHGAPPEIVGIRNLRGRIVTVVDLAAHLGLGRVVIGPETRLLIIEDEGESYGFLVDAVTDAIEIEEGGIGRAPDSLDPGLRSRLRGVWREDDHLIAILDPVELFRWEEPLA
jgi:purine-binding chemotaxis protein CheW